MRKKRGSILQQSPDLKEELRLLALSDFDRFLEVLQLDDIQIFICVHHTKGKTLGQIMQSLRGKGIDIGRTTISDRCKQCSE